MEVRASVRSFGEAPILAVSSASISCCSTRVSEVQTFSVSSPAWTAARPHPERKGVVERAKGYLETSFMPGRSFADVDDFNTQLADWLEHRANVRVHSGLGRRPTERIDEDLAAMTALPPVLPDMDWHHDLRLPKDHWVRHQTNDYSVHPKAVGRRVHVKVDDSVVTVTLGKEVVGRHDRVLASHVRSTTPPTTELARPLEGFGLARRTARTSRSPTSPSTTRSPVRHERRSGSRVPVQGAEDAVVDGRRRAPRRARPS
jgi:hypothetical protein